MRTRFLAAALILISGSGCGRRSIGVRVSKAVAANVAHNLQRPAAPASYELRLGKMVFAYYCQTCHGETGAGDGFNAFNLDPKPRDLSDPAFQKKKTDQDLEDAVRRGGSGVGLTALMPPWGKTLSDRQIAEVVLYVRTLARK
jgi:mono/diheme cytochrome c family protein